MLFWRLKQFKALNGKTSELQHRNYFLKTLLIIISCNSKNLIYLVVAVTAILLALVLHILDSNLKAAFSTALKSSSRTGLEATSVSLGRLTSIT